MTTQAVTDIKELVGEMPARGCECRIHGCNGRQHAMNACDHQAAWSALVHGMDHTGHGDFELNLCDRCLDTAASIADFTGECRVCGNGYALRVMPL
ncbi:Uncharacterised protein [Mycobacteroides abscessus subsp. massiliense]|nr:hypothetical protein [Mycobacteroides abscessus]SHQ55960.1 Uncharacterised protein [Mycobacteroides abscessus subsp. abscessus]SIM40465.1 Uncharacterised protein [Mycobacteroides abscessus subsp. bolletii]SKD93664.1 Uncharacterised protein [Mycobacteroides abscessus subsp. massiliense]MBE5429576.1 hypothetical protein [Mycobacteroides abscessus]